MHANKTELIAYIVVDFFNLHVITSMSSPNNISSLGEFNPKAYSGELFDSRTSISSVKC